jgi:hypothetical protein
MKTQLQPSTAVEAQKAPAPNLTLFLGLDVHNDSIAVSLPPSDSTEVRRYGVIGGTQAHGQKLTRCEVTWCSNRSW